MAVTDKFNEELLVSLGLHLTPALDRLLDDSQIENPLLQRLKKDILKNLQWQKS